MKAQILLVEDDPGMAGMTKILLKSHGYKVQAVTTAEEALEEIRKELPDLLISDIQLPGLSGTRLCEILKGEPRTASLPVILLTVLGKNIDKVQGLKIGADDYLTKPYSPDELAARVEALLRRVRYAGVPQQTYKFKDLTVDFSRHEVRIEDELITLRRKEYEILALLIQKKGQVLTREAFTQLLWKDESIVTGNTLNVHVRNLRKKLGHYQNLVMTLVGEGYKLNEED
jgi:DNA-binding response OmpR family regulator